MRSPTADNRTPLQLAPCDGERYVELRRRMLIDSPWSFSASLDTDRGLDLEHVRRLFGDPHHATFAFVAADRPSLGESDGGAMPSPSVLIAATNITRVSARKHAHRANVWGVFVEPAHRGRGLGRALMIAAIERARTWTGVDFVDLAVSANAPEAQRLYERLGFVAWGRQPEALGHDGRRFDEIHMSLRL